MKIVKATSVDKMLRVFEDTLKDAGIESCTSVKATSYIDTEGNFGGERGEVYTEEWLRQYFKENKGADPVLDQYDSFEDWLTDSMEAGLKIQYDVDATDHDAQETEEIDEEHLEPVIGSYSDDDSIYEEIKHKQVQDIDGFYTDYTMYEDTLNGGYVFVFGDRDLYRPEDGDFDFECDTLQEAEDWFDDYVGFVEEGEDDLLYL